MLLKGTLRVPGTLDGGLSWFAVLGSFMTQFVVMGIHNVFGLLYLDLLTEFGESKATTGKKATPNFLQEFQTEFWPSLDSLAVRMSGKGFLTSQRTAAKETMLPLTTFRIE